jgi:membrane protein
MASRGMFGGLTLKELASRTWSESNEDNALGYAAQLAYYFLLALFPLLIFLTSLVGFLGGAQELLLQFLGKVMPSDAMDIVNSWMRDVVTNKGGGLLSFGLLAAIWAASAGLAALIDALNTAYDVKEGRPFWKVRLIAVALTLALGLLVVGGAVLITASDALVGWVAARLGLSAVVQAVWQYVNYLIGVALLLAGVSLVYYFAPNVEQKWHWITPGSVFATVTFLVASFCFSLYLRYAPSYSATYGSLGAVVVLMLWLYLLGLVVFVGGEINQIIEKAQGKPFVEKQEGQQVSRLRTA